MPLLRQSQYATAPGQERPKSSASYAAVTSKSPARLALSPAAKLYAAPGETVQVESTHIVIHTAKKSSSAFSLRIDGVFRDEPRPIQLLQHFGPRVPRSHVGHGHLQSGLGRLPVTTVLAEVKMRLLRFWVT